MKTCSHLKIKKHVNFIREKITRAMVTKSNVAFTAKIYKSEKVWSFPQVEDQWNSSGLGYKI